MQNIHAVVGVWKTITVAFVYMYAWIKNKFDYDKKIAQIKKDKSYDYKSQQHNTHNTLVHARHKRTLMLHHFTISIDLVSMFNKTIWHVRKIRN